LKRGLSLAIAVLVVAACGRNPEPPRNVILLTIDTLRADRVGVYGASDVETPNLDRLAREGAKADRASAHVPLTRPSHASLFTGMLPTTHGIRDNISPASLPDVPTLTTVLKGAGFRTAAFVSSVVLASGGGFERGFDSYLDDFGEEAEASAGALFLNSLQRPGDETIAAATSWLEANREGPFFAWIHLYDPHEPYEPPEPYRSRYAERPYDGESSTSAWSAASRPASSRR
jgi:arylsulfatase A-like enzyme